MADKPVRADKATAVAELTESFRNSARHRADRVPRPDGCPAHRSCGARSARETTYTVAKNTLAKRAATDAGITGLDELFTGPTALAFVSGDSSRRRRGCATSRRPTRCSSSRAASSRARPSPRPRSRKLADLESREVLLAKLAGAMKGNLSKAAALFQAPLSQAARLAAALQDKREKEGAEAA